MAAFPVAATAGDVAEREIQARVGTGRDGTGEKALARARTRSICAMPVLSGRTEKPTRRVSALLRGWCFLGNFALCFYVVQCNNCVSPPPACIGLQIWHSCRRYHTDATPLNSRVFLPSLTHSFLHHARLSFSPATRKPATTVKPCAAIAGGSRGARVRPLLFHRAPAMKLKSSQT